MAECEGPEEFPDPSEKLTDETSRELGGPAHGGLGSEPELCAEQGECVVEDAECTGEPIPDDSGFLERTNSSTRMKPLFPNSKFHVA